MSLNSLPTEIVQKILASANLEDALNLSRASRTCYRALQGRQNHILRQAMDNSYGPLGPLYQLALLSIESVSNRNRMVSTEIRRTAMLDRITQTPPDPVLTIATMEKMLPYGRTATTWVELFPQFRWRKDFLNRRVLRPHEQERLRRAVYNYWIYTNLFEDQTFTSYSPGESFSARFMRSETDDDLRYRFLRTLTTDELIQLSELTFHVLRVLQLDLYPSDAVIKSDAFVKDEGVQSFMRLLGWGTGQMYRSIIEDLMKYSPEDIVYLYSHTSCKNERIKYIKQATKFESRSPGTLPDALARLACERLHHEGSATPGFPTLDYSGLLSSAHYKIDPNPKWGITDVGEEGVEQKDRFWSENAVTSGVVWMAENSGEDIERLEGAFEDQLSMWD